MYFWDTVYSACKNFWTQHLLKAEILFFPKKSICTSKSTWLVDHSLNAGGNARSSSFYARKQLLHALTRFSHRNSVRLSARPFVRHTGESVKNDAIATRFYEIHLLSVILPVCSGYQTLRSLCGGLFL